jgi:MFS family permease
VKEAEFAKTVIEAINKIGSAFYGPILAAFVLGVLSKRVGALDVIISVIVGVSVNIALWVGAPQVHWMWWNLIGFAVSCGLALGLSAVTPQPTEEQILRYTLSGAGMWEEEKKWFGTYATLLGYFVFILVVGLSLGAVA